MQQNKLPHEYYVKVKISLLQTMEAPRDARGRGSHITQDKWLTDGGKALHAGRTLPPGFCFKIPGTHFC
jgi:hypothetical protein